MKNTHSKTQDFKPMNKDAFWEVMTEAHKRKNTHDINGLDEALMEVLEENYSNQALVEFDLLIKKIRGELPAETYEIAKQILSYDNIDGAPYHRFRNWVIALGKEHYQNAVKDPAYLLTLKDPNLYVAGQALFEDLDHITPAVYYDRQEENPLLPEWDALLANARTKERLGTIRDKDDRDYGMER